jgi:thiol:disulfide interchange protein DsbD
MQRWFLVGLLALFGNTLAAPVEHPAKADLLANVSTVEAGKPFQIAVRMTMQPGWHIYWIDPGDSGSPTQITWHAPAGWKVEPLPFPTPHKFIMPGDIVNNGYADEVLFLASVTPPADAKGPVELSADVEWLVCDVQQCLPGKGSPKLSLTAGEKAVADNEDLFRTWQQQIPAAADTSATPIASTMIMPGEMGQHGIRLTWKEPVKKVEAFLAPPAGWLLDQVKTTPDNRTTTRLAFTAKPNGKDVKPGDMTVLFVYDDEGGVRRSVQLTYPLKP